LCSYLFTITICAWIKFKLIVVVKALKDLFEISQLSGLRDHNDLEADNSYNFLFKLGALDLALSEGYQRVPNELPADNLVPRGSMAWRRSRKAK